MVRKEIIILGYIRLLANSFSFAFCSNNLSPDIYQATLRMQKLYQNEATT